MIAWLLYDYSKIDTFLVDIEAFVNFSGQSIIGDLENGG